MLKSTPLSRSELGILVQNITTAVLASLGTPIPRVTSVPAAPKRRGGWTVPKGHTERINRERDKYFKKMGYGKYRKLKAKPKRTAKKIAA